MPQFYGEGGVPLEVAMERAAPAQAWRSQRLRLRSWLEALPEAAWAGPTRCSLWDVAGLVRHLVSGSQFLGWTLHNANAGIPTTLLQGFDTQESPRQAAEMVAQSTPDTAASALRAADEKVEAELSVLDGTSWSAIAEAPPGHLPAHLALGHFVWDSWVHERDLLLPRGQHPPLDRQETEVVMAYLAGLATVAVESDVPLDLRLSEPELRVGVERVRGRVEVTVGTAPPGGVVVEGALSEVVDRATGRPSAALRGDARAIGVLDAFAKVLAG